MIAGLLIGLFVLLYIAGVMKGAFDSLPAFEGHDDPVQHCTVYKSRGCSHVDGMGCDMDSCKILRDELDERRL